MVKPVRAVVESVKSVAELWRSDAAADEIEDEEMTILEHLAELRTRIIKMAIAVALCTVLALIFAPRIFELLLLPAPPGFKPQSIQVTETFVTYFKVSLTAGIGLSLPVLVYQIISFIAPGLTRREKRLLFSMLPLLAFFFVVGAAFGYFVTLRFALSFLLGFGTDIATPAPRLSDYIGITTTILFWMGLSFELPVVVLTLSKLGLVTPQRLASFRRYAILVFFVIAAIITPTPDPLNQTMVAVPMIVLYEVGILMARTL